MQALDTQNSDPVSFLTPIGYQTGDCGYCKGRDTSQRTPNSRVSFYVSTKYLHTDHYQILVDRGWRRSGTLLYKPDLRHSCCPHYTIRLPVDQFKPRRDQRQAVHRWNKYVLGDEYIKESTRLYPKSKEDKARRNDFDLVSATHESEYYKLKRPPEPAHKFEVTLEVDDFTQEKFELYKNYQHHVHHDSLSSISPNGFRRFLCDSPLIRRTCGDKKFGSFHQCYRLDGRLVAMAVLDLLPHCVSGVYFIYHSDFEKWSLGKISALREAAFALEAGYGYYYMGYYIHSCAKMLYKNDYKPQTVLDLENGTWNPFDEEFRKQLDEHRYFSPSQSGKKEIHDPKTGSERQVFDSALAVGDAIDDGLSLFHIDFPGMMTVSDLNKNIDLDKILIQIRPDLVVHAEDLVRWDDWDICGRDPKALVAQIAACVGAEVAGGMVISFSG